MTQFNLLRAGAAALALSLPATTLAVPYSADLNPLSGSGVEGSADLELDLENDILDVSIGATGLEAGQPHPQHIHGIVEGGEPVDSTSPTLEQDEDGDDFIELAEGRVTYGPVLVPLTSPPGGAVEDFPAAPGGTVNFSQQYDLNDSATFAGDFDASDLGTDLGLREIVLHGRTVGAEDGVGTGGEVNGTAGYKATLPVAAGEIVQDDTADVPSPAAISLLGVGLLGLATGQRGRRAG